MDPNQYREVMNAAMGGGDGDGEDITITGAVSLADTTGNTGMVGRCRLTVSKPVLKAPMVSALETII